MNKLEKRVPFLATIASVAPFIGLFGTVWGILITFQRIGVTGSTNLATVGPGIADALVAELAARSPEAEAWSARDRGRRTAVGQQRLLDLAARGEVLDDNLWTTPGRFGGGGAGTTWLVGSAEDVAKSLRRYQDLGVTHFVLSDTPYLREIERQGTRLLPLLRD